MSWNQKLKDLPPVERLGDLPHYGAIFFFQNMGPLKRLFLLLTAASMVGAALRFTAVYLLGEVISKLQDLSLETIFTVFLPLYLVVLCSREVLDFFLRKYAEAFPTVYAEHLTLRFYMTLLRYPFRRLFNVSKERLTALVDKYVANVQAFLTDWFWGTSRKIVQLIIVVIILYVQNPLVLLINGGYTVLFLALALHISARFSPVAAAYSRQSFDSTAVSKRFALNLNALKRLGARVFFGDVSKLVLEQNWIRLQEVKTFHAKRWLLQLNLFNFLYIGTLFHGIYEVKHGRLELGFLVLIKYAFDQLWEILVYVIEYYVSLIQQREDARIVNHEFGNLLGTSHQRSEAPYQPSDWSHLTLKNILVEYPSESPDKPGLRISVPELSIRRGERIGVVGENGSGKSTLLNVLLNVTTYSGSYRIDEQELGEKEFASDFVAAINSFDPLFNVSIRDNIVLGRVVERNRVEEVLNGLQAPKVRQSLELKYGESEVNFSSGQEQRIRLARGIIQGSEIYLLDEPLSAIDEAARPELLAYLDSALEGKTVVLVTHDKRELSLVDRVYEFKDHVLEAV